MNVQTPLPHNDHVEVESQRTVASPVAEVEAVVAAADGLDADAGVEEGGGEGERVEEVVCLAPNPAALSEAVTPAPAEVACTCGVLAADWTLRGAREGVLRGARVTTMSVEEEVFDVGVEGDEVVAAALLVGVSWTTEALLVLIPLLAPALDRDEALGFVGGAVTEEGEMVTFVSSSKGQLAILVAGSLFDMPPRYVTDAPGLGKTI